MSEESSDGIGFIGLLQLLFIALKLTGHIAWNWFYVLLPFESVIAVYLFMALVCLPDWIEDWIYDYKENRKNKKKEGNEL